MNLKITGTTSDSLKAKIESCVRFCATQQLGDKTAKRLNIWVRVSKNLIKYENALGLASAEDNRHKCRNFEIRLDSNAAPRDILQTLCHEMIHVKQFATGEFKMGWAKSRWQGRSIVHDMLEYKQLPWEAEAFGNEKKLYRAWRNSG